MMKRSIVLAATGAAALSLAAAMSGCSSSDSTTTPTTPATDAGSTADSATTNPNNATLSGTIIDYVDHGGHPGWSTAAAGVTAVTDAKGAFSLSIPKDTTFNLTVSDPSYFSLYYQDAKLSGDYAFPDSIRFVSKSIGASLLTVLGADANKGIVSIELSASDACLAKASDFPSGAKLTVGQSDAKLAYYKSTPDPTLTSAQAGASPAAVAYNLTPDAAFNVTVDYTKCTMKPFPVSDGNLTYTGTFAPKAPNVLSVYTLYFD